MIWETSSLGVNSLTAVFTMVKAFLEGFLGCVIEVIKMIFDEPWLALVIVGIPLSMLIFRWAKKLAKIKT